MTRPLVGAAIVLLATAALGQDQMPRLSVEKGCLAAKSGEARPQQVYEACLEDERQAQSQLAAGAWRQAGSSSRATCAGNQRTSAAQSYVELLTCVQLMDGTTIRPTNPK